MKSRVVVIILLLRLAPPVHAQPAQPADPPEAAFHAAVAAYLDLQNQLKKEVPTLRVGMEGAEISRASDIIAAALQRSRRNARQGDIFNAEVAKLITVRLQQQLAGVNIERFLVSIADEPARFDRPSIHKRYPAAASMATMPARVLAILPPLPDALWYRFIGRALILRDRDAAMIVDYIPDALPAR